MDPKPKTAGAPAAPPAPTPRKKRITRPLPDVARNLFEQVVAEREANKAKLKEAKHVGKLLASIPTLSEWALEHVNKALAERALELHKAKQDAEPAKP